MVDIDIDWKFLTGREFRSCALPERHGEKSPWRSCFVRWIGQSRDHSPMFSGFFAKLSSARSIILSKVAFFLPERSHFLFSLFRNGQCPG